jgi:2-C-methyl-D-erythritol 4-phosphate cytidylyltransferase
MYKGYNFTAIVLAGGSGKRMKASKAKQLIELDGYPMLYYSLKAFADSPVDSIVLVTSKEHLEYCQKEIIDKYKISKVVSVVLGGKERYHSSINGVLASPKTSDYVLIHDSARPCIDNQLIISCMENVIKHENCTTAILTVDTICQIDKDKRIVNIPNRNELWSIQTPQCFNYEDIKKAGKLFIKEEDSMVESEKKAITDDVAVLKRFLEKEVYVFEGSCDNIKVTNMADIVKVESFLRKRSSR